MWYSRYRDKTKERQKQLIFFFSVLLPITIFLLIFQATSYFYPPPIKLMLILKSLLPPPIAIVPSIQYLRECLNMPEYSWIYWIYWTMTKSVRMAFVLHVTIIISFLLEHVIIYFNEVYSPRKNAVFLKWKNLIFFLSSWKYLICSFFIFCCFVLD